LQWSVRWGGVCGRDGLPAGDQSSGPWLQGVWCMDLPSRTARGQRASHRRTVLPLKTASQAVNGQRRPPEEEAMHGPARSDAQGLVYGDVWGTNQVSWRDTSSGHKCRYITPVPPASPPHPRQRPGPPGSLPRPILGGPPHRRRRCQLRCRHHRMACPRQIRRQILCLVPVPAPITTLLSLPLYHSHTGLSRYCLLLLLRALPVALRSASAPHPPQLTIITEAGQQDFPFTNADSFSDKLQQSNIKRLSLPHTTPDVLVLFINASRTLS
jgi:hypothetical protein